MKERWFDLNKLVSKITAARLYGCTPAAINHHMRKGLLEPVFIDGRVKLFNREDILALKKLGFRPGRTKKPVKKQ